MYFTLSFVAEDVKESSLPPLLSEPECFFLCRRLRSTHESP